jgi:UDP-N-acetylmuramoylalanine--D-glutamate ligase
MNFEGKKVLVVGMARSGIGAAKLLKELGAIVTINDSSSEEVLGEKIKKLEGIYDQKILGETPSDMSTFDYVVLSPGVPTDLGFLKEAREKGVKVIGELELGYLIAKGDFIALTGTNGKTTTTTLVGDIFENSGADMRLVGNIGYPVVEKVLDSTEKSIFVTEVSSFQLETVEEFNPKIAAMLNITPDHLNRHKTMENYIEAKARIFENHGEDSFLVINSNCKDDFNLKDYPGTILQFSSKGKVDKGAFLKGDEIILKITDEKVLCNIKDLFVKGDHNYENVMAAALMAYAYGVDLEVIRKSVLDFKGVEHRIEYVEEFDGRYFFNDSKGTNPDATMVAIKAMDKATVLILGGKDKGSEFDEMVKSFGQTVDSVVALGDTKYIIEKSCRDAGFNKVYIVSDMKEAVEKAYEISSEDMNILLSPACASWDMYENFEVRGKHFKQCVKELRG